MFRFALAVFVALGWCSLAARQALAAPLPGAELTVQRSSAAAGCPSEEAVVRELTRRLAARPPAHDRLELSVKIDVVGSAFTADIEVGGRRQGQRTLSAEGPGCEALRDVLLVSLLLLLDDDAESEAPPNPPRFPVESSASLWLSAGGAATHGFPSGWSSAWYADLVVRSPSWDVALGGAWAPEQSLQFAPGAVNIRSLALRAHGCYVLGAGQLRAGGCLFSVLSTLHGQGRDFTNTDSARRTWLLLGAGPELRWAPWARLSFGISGQLLVSPARQSFAIRGLPGPAYRTDRWVPWVGADLSLRLW